MLSKKLLCLAALVPLPLFGLPISYGASSVTPPDPVQEFRGVWIATVNNTDWPSRRGLTAAQQQSELTNLLDRAVQLRLNAVIFQVRPQGDAFYASSFEPWSEYLTGEMGRDPGYDPLAFALREAHKRALELHAWFNPYRALDSSHAGIVADTHVSVAHPGLVRTYGKFLWLDPGEREVQEYTLKVVMDMVNHYDVDGVHFDDYFYPGKEAGETNDFPDEASWKKFGRGDRGDWRRANVDSFIQRTYQSIKAAKPWVKFGISPRGIWRPGFPQQIRGADAYAGSYADSRKWLANGWVDYLAPQIYWPINPPEQSFRALLNWWSYQNPQKRHIWPGMAAYRSKEWSADEIPNQIWLARHQQQSGVSGYIFYNASSLFQNAALTQALSQNLQLSPAIVPISPWLARTLPLAPSMTVSQNVNGARASWTSSDPTIRHWLLQARFVNLATKQIYWQTQILPLEQTRYTYYGSGAFLPNVIVVRAVDRVGAVSNPMSMGIASADGIPERSPGVGLAQTASGR